MNLVLGLVFKNADGSLSEEAWQYLGCAAVDDAVENAHVDGVAGEFGRVYVGVGSVIALDEHDGFNIRPFDSAMSLRARPARVQADAPWTQVAEIEAVPWWRFVSAFGPGTVVGVHLRRCLAQDVDDAVAAAEVVGEAVAHQMTLYDVTPAATAAMGALLEHVVPAVREVLVGWLDVIAECSGSDADSPEAMRAALVEEGTPDWLIDDLVARAVVSADSASACRAALLTPLFDRLVAQKLAGTAVIALRRSVS